MFFKSVRTQMNIIFKQRLFALTILIIYVFIIINYVNNLIEFYGCDVSALIHPMKMSLLNSYGKWGFYFMQYLPLILVIPASFSFLKDKDNETIVYLSAKLGIKNYYYGKLISVFVMTFLAFFIPFIFEYLINVITFPIQAIGDRSNLPTLDTSYLEMETRYLFPKLWQFNSYLYFLVFIIMLSFVMASFAAFVVSVTMLPIIKYKILAFLPAFLLLTMISSIGRNLSTNMNYIYHLMAFDSTDKINELYPVISIFLLLVSVIITNWRAKKEL